MARRMVEGRGLSMWFPDKFLFRRLNIVVNEGDMVAIVGPSGVGKTTLLKILGLLLRPKEGRVVIRDVDTIEYPGRKLYLLRRRYIGYSFQEPIFVPTLNALDNILIPIYPYVKDEKLSEEARTIIYAVHVDQKLLEMACKKIEIGDQ